MDSRCDCVEWSGGGDPATASGSCSFTTKWATAGVKSVTAASPCSSKGKSVTVVAVGAIEINYTAESWDDVTDETIVVLMGTKYTFRAMPNPTGANWPSGSPVWSGAASGTGATIEVTFDSEGTETLTAKCGCCEDGKTVTITVVKPQPDEVGFVDNNSEEEHDIYNVTDPVWKRVNNPNNPASYTMNVNVKMQARFWAASNLTYSTMVYVDAEFSGGWTFTGDSDVTFGTTWPSEVTTHVSDQFLSNSIGWTSSDCLWGYKVPSGTNEWIYMLSQSGPHKIYRVFGAPSYGTPSGTSAFDTGNYTESNISEAVNMVYDVSYPNETNIASLANTRVSRKLDEGCICNAGFQTNFDAAMKRYPSGDDGMCCCRAEGLNCVLRVLGIGPYTKVYCNEMPEDLWGPLRHYCNGTCDTHGYAQRCFWGFSLPNCWEGAIRTGGVGSRCYAPGVGEGGQPLESTHDGIADNWTYYWFYYDAGAWHQCTQACTIVPQSFCSGHSSYWDRFVSP